jgi:hypothetical protein
VTTIHAAGLPLNQSAGVETISVASSAGTTKAETNLVREVEAYGYFLQRYSASVIKHAGFHIEEEYPITLGYSLGQQTYVYESSVDVLARRHNREADYEIVLHTQSKQQSSKDWFFFPELGKSLVRFNQISRLESKPFVASHFGEISLSKWPGPDVPVCTIGRELRDDSTDPTMNEFGRHGRDAVYDARREAAFSVKSVIAESRRYDGDLVKEDGLYSVLAANSLHIPLVVTAASLHLVELDAADSKMEVAANAKSRVAPYLVYSFPLNRYLQIDFDLPEPEGLHRLNHLNIFVVNYQSLDSFLRTLVNYFVGHHEDSFHQPRQAQDEPT